MTMFEFQSHVTLNCLLWVTSLDIRDQGVTDRVLEDMSPLLAKKDIPWTLATPITASEFWKVLDWVEDIAAFGAFPIIHFDMHGSSGKGMLIAQSNEYVSWRSISDKLKAINRLTHNNLCVVTSVCFGYKVTEALNITSASPFYMLIAPTATVEAAFFADKLYNFYEHLFESKSIVAAYELHLQKEMEFFQCEKALLIIFVRYVLQDCVGRGGDARRERLLTEAMKRGLVNNRHNRRFIRGRAKTMIKPTQALLDETAKVFLLRKEVGFTIHDVL